MELLYRRCAGLDVHKDTVVACVRIANATSKAQEEVRTFGTTTKGLLELSEWLGSHECTHVAMESTGVYWKPVWHVLEDDFELVLANASHVRNVPGRKSDVSDAVWIADLLAHGLLRSSFVPPVAIQQMREYTRTRKQMVRERVRHVQRIQKVLEDANIKLASFVSDIMGVSGRKMIAAIIAGESDPERLADLAHPRLETARHKLVESLRGRVTDHHRFMLNLHMRHIESIDEAISSIESQIDESLDPFREVTDLLTGIPGVNDTASQVIVSEVGVDMERFPEVSHLISWARICPRMDESAGKRRSNRVSKGCNWLKPVLVQCAWAAVRKKDSYLRAQYLRIKSRRGAKKAIMAVASSILTAAYFIIRDRVPYSDLGADYFDNLDRERVVVRLRKRLGDLGYEVELRKIA